MRRRPHRLSTAVGAITFVLTCIAAVATAGSVAGAQEDDGEVGGVVDSGIPTTTVPQTAAPTRAPVSTLAAGCPKPIEPTVVFVGTMLFFFTDDRAKPYFQVSELRFGSLDGRLLQVRPPTGQYAGKLLTDLVPVDFGNDANFLRVGAEYLVAARLDTKSKALYSRVAPIPPRFGENQVIGVDDGGTPLVCPIRINNVMTRLADGTPVDSGVLSGLNGAQRRMGLAFAIPAAICLGALVVVALLRRVMRGVGLAIARFIRRRSAKGRRRRAIRRSNRDRAKAAAQRAAVAEAAADGDELSDEDPWEVFAATGASDAGGAAGSSGGSAEA